MAAAPMPEPAHQAGKAKTVYHLRARDVRRQEEDDEQQERRTRSEETQAVMTVRDAKMMMQKQRKRMRSSDGTAKTPASVGMVLELERMLHERAEMQCDLCAETCTAKSREALDAKWKECRRRVMKMFGFGETLSSGGTASGAVVSVAVAPESESDRQELEKKYPKYYQLLQSSAAAVKVIQFFLLSAGAKRVNYDRLKKIFKYKPDRLIETASNVIEGSIHDIVHEIAVGLVLRNVVVLAGRSPCFSVPLYVGICPGIITPGLPPGKEEELNTNLFSWTGYMASNHKEYSERQAVIVQTRVDKSSRRYILSAKSDEDKNRYGLGLACQLLHALDAARTACGFVHNDLHYGNVCVVKTSPRVASACWEFGHADGIVLHLPVELHNGHLCSIIDFGRSVIPSTQRIVSDANAPHIPTVVHDMVCRGSTAQLAMSKTPAPAAGSSDMADDAQGAFAALDETTKVETGGMLAGYADMGISDKVDQPNYTFDVFNWFIDMVRMTPWPVDSEMFRLIDAAVPVKMDAALLDEFVGRIIMDTKFSKLQAILLAVVAKHLKDTVVVGAASIMDVVRHSYGEVASGRAIKSMKISGQKKTYVLSPSSVKEFNPSKDIMESILKRLDTRKLVTDRASIYSDSGIASNRYRAIALGTYVFTGDSTLIGDLKLASETGTLVEDILRRINNIADITDVQELLNDDGDFMQETIGSALKYTCVFTDHYPGIVPLGQDVSKYVPSADDYKNHLRNVYIHAIGILATYVDQNYLENHVLMTKSIRQSMFGHSVRTMAATGVAARADTLVDILVDEDREIGADFSGLADSAGSSRATRQHFHQAEASGKTAPCAFCGEDAASVCSGCVSAAYCNTHHQALHWLSHRHICRSAPH